MNWLAADYGGWFSFADYSDVVHRRRTGQVIFSDTASTVMAVYVVGATRQSRHVEVVRLFDGNPGSEATLPLHLDGDNTDRSMTWNTNGCGEASVCGVSSR